MDIGVNTGSIKLKKWQLLAIMQLSSNAITRPSNLRKLNSKRKAKPKLLLTRLGIVS